MGRVQIGERVGAIMSAKDGIVNLLGYGVRAEDKVPPENASGFGSALHNAGIPNICLLLDSGKEVFGCECWWGPEEAIKKNYEGWKVVEVDIDEVRKEEGEV